MEARRANDPKSKINIVRETGPNANANERKVQKMIRSQELNSKQQSINKLQKPDYLIPSISTLNRIELHEQTVALEIDLRTKCAAVASLQTSVKNLQYEIKDINSSLQQEEFWRVATSDRFKYYDSAITLLQTNFIKVNDKLNASELIRLDLSNKYKDLLNHNNSLLKENLNFQKSATIDNEKCADYKALVDDLTSKNALLSVVEVEHNKLKMMYEKLENTVCELKDIIEKKEKNHLIENENNIQRMNEDKNSIVKLKAQIAEYEHQKNINLNEKFSNEQIVKKLKEAINLKDRELQEMQVTSEQNKSYNFGVYKKIEQKCKRMENANHELNAELIKCEKSLATQTNDYSVMQHNQMEIYRSLTNLQNLNSNLTKELEIEKTRAQDFLDKLTMEIQEKSRCTAANDELFAQLNNKTQELANLEENKTSLDLIISNLQKENLELKAKIMVQPVTIPETSAELDIDDLCNFENIDGELNKYLSPSVSQTSSVGTSSVFHPPKLTTLQQRNLEKNRKIKKSKMFNYNSDSSSEMYNRSKVSDSRNHHFQKGSSRKKLPDQDQKYEPLYSDSIISE